MAITYVGSGASSTGNNTSVNPTVSGSTAAGDLVLIHAAIRNTAGSVATPVGWTKAVEGGNQAILARIWQPGDSPPTVTFTGGVAGADTIAQAVTFRGTEPDVATAIVASPGIQSNSTPAQNIAYPGLTVPGDGHALVLAVWKQDDASSVSTPGGWTAAGFASTTTGDDASLATRVVVQTTPVDLVAGSLTVTGGTTAISRAIVLALRPLTKITASAQPGTTPPRVELAVEWSAASEVQIARNDPDGRTRPVRLAEPAELTAGAWTGYDYEAPYDASVTYTASVGATTVSSSSLTLFSGGVTWLRHPGTPSLSIPVEVVAPLEDRVRAVNQAVLMPLGRRDPIVVTDGRRKTPSSGITFRTRDPADAAAFEAIIDDATPLLLSVSTDYGLGFTHAYLALGEIRERARNPRLGLDRVREWAAPYIVVDRPAGGQAADRTWAAVLVEAATWTDLMAMYDTWGDVISGNGS